METKYRIFLNKDSHDFLVKMLDSMGHEEEFLKINASKLCSWIIIKFSNDYFPQNKERIKKDHFNPKEYLRNLASSVKETDNVEGILQETLNQLQKSRATINAKVQKKNRPKTAQESKVE